MDVAQFYNWLARKRDRWVLARQIARQLKLLMATQKTEYHYNLIGGRLTSCQYWPSQVKIQVQPGAYYPFWVHVTGISYADAKRLAIHLRRRSIGVEMISGTDDGATLHTRLVATQPHNSF